MTDLNKLVEKLNESCKGESDNQCIQLNQWTKKILLDGNWGCKKEDFYGLCGNCDDTLQWICEHQMERFKKKCCNDCQKECRKHITNDIIRFQTDEQIKTKIETFDYCKHCRTNFKIEEAKVNFKDPDNDIMDALRDCLDIFQNLSNEIDEIKQKLNKSAT